MQEAAGAQPEIEVDEGRERVTRGRPLAPSLGVVVPARASHLNARHPPPPTRLLLYSAPCLAVNARPLKLLLLPAAAAAVQMLMLRRRAVAQRGLSR